MKEEYNLKEVIDESLEDIKIDRMLEETIKAKCLGQRSMGFKVYKNIVKAAAWFVGIACACSGTLYALNHVEGFSRFMEDTYLRQVAPHVQTINKGDGKGEAKLVVEEAITDHYNSLLIFSFINEGEEPWKEGIKAGSWSQSWTGSAGYGPPVLSEDGRKLTYYVEGYSREDILQDKALKLKANNLIYVSEVEGDIDIPLGELFKAHKIVLDHSDYDYSTRSKELYMHLDRMLKKEVGATQRHILKEDPKVTFEYVAMIQDSELEDPNNPAGGLTLYTRNESDKYWTGSSHDYVTGVISEVTDIRTGEVYEADLKAIEYDVDTLWRGALGVSQFSDLMDPSMIPYLKATKVTYTVQEVIVKDKWDVEFKLEDTTTIQPVKLDLYFEDSGESVNINQADISVLGVTLQGTRAGKREKPSQYAIYSKTTVQLQMKDGQMINLRSDTMMGDKDKFIASYIVVDDRDEKSFIEVEQIESIFINDQEIEIK